MTSFPNFSRIPFYIFALVTVVHCSMEEVSPTASFDKLIATASPTDSNLVYSPFTESSRLYFTSTHSPPGPPGPVKLVYMV